MRFMKDLSQETLSLLQRMYRQSQYYRVRQRAHCIILSYQGYTAKVHIPSDLVVGQLPSYVEGSSALDFPWIHDARSQDQP